MNDIPTVFQRVVKLLKESQVQFDQLQHEPVFTSEQAAQVRGVPLSSGAKALICKLQDQFVMFVIPADRKLNSKQVRKRLNARNLRFANLNEVQELTGLEPGSIPPFGSLFGLRTYCDKHLANESQINFNTGDHARSVSIRYTDFVRVEDPQIGEFA